MSPGWRDHRAVGPATVLHCTHDHANMHLVSMSATSQRGTGLRERKRAATRESLVAAARSFSAERGFSHWTVEQLCEEVGVSRRTFFNYFPSKEAAFLGQAEAGIPADLAERFVSRGTPAGGAGPAPGAGGLSPGLLEDMADLACTLAEATPLTRAAFDQVMAAIDRDAKVLPLMRQSIERRDAAFRRLIARREGIDPEDPRAHVATAVLTAVAHRTLAAFFQPDNTRTYRQVFTTYVAAARAVLQT
jgi:AcrR family transcriptional regulator